MPERALEVKMREELQSYAQMVSQKCRKLMEETARLTCFVEDLLKYRDLYDTSINGMDDRYKSIGKACVLIEEGNLYMNGATGAVPVDERLKKEMRLYEHAKPRLKDAKDQLDYCDEMWFFTTENLISGWVDYEYIARAMPNLQGIDLTKIHGQRLLRFNWFDIVNPVNNPARKGVWSPFPFIEMFGVWVFTYFYPIYEADRFKGIFAPHAKIEPMLADSIYRSPEKMMAIHEDGTLIGMNEAAAESFSLKAYKTRLWQELQEKVIYVREDLSLMRNATADYAWLSDGLRWQKEFNLMIEGNSYSVMKERIPEIGVNLVAFLDK